MLESSLNLAWVLICAFLVMFMQLGFAMVETGFTRSKNAVHTMAMNFVIYPIGIVGFWLVGYGIAMGGVEGWRSLGPSVSDHLELGIHIGSHFVGLLGGTKFGLMSVAHDPPNLAMFMFSVVFMDTAATIPHGSARRSDGGSCPSSSTASSWRRSSIPSIPNWVWGGGWLTHPWARTSVSGTGWSTSPDRPSCT